jgi:hypothetical protein
MRAFTILLVLVATVFSVSAGAQRSQILKGVKQITVEDAVVGNKEKVKEDFAPTLVTDSLRDALRNANIEVVETGAPVRTHIVLDEFTSGSTAKRFLVGFGSGRSTIDGRLIFQDSSGKELANIPIRVRGNLVWSSYQGGTRSADKRRTASISGLPKRLRG